MARTILFTLCFLIFFCSKSAAQVQAGVTDNLSVNLNTPGETVNIVPLYLPGQSFGPNAEDSLDLDRDGQFDVWFYCYSCNTIDCIGGGTFAKSLHGKVEFVVDADNEIRQLNSGDAIDDAQIWKEIDATALTTRFYGVGGYEQFGNWFPQQEGYAGIRIFSGPDTLYGWIRIKAFANPQGGSMVQVFAWAIENETTVNQSVDYIIAGQTGDLVPGNKTIALQQESIPFGSGAGQVDSLDLNWDGKHDVAFNAIVCNTFDCVQSNTLCIGMHEGFTFELGQQYPRNLESGDTIFANANWNIQSNPNKVGLFTKLGMGFNGFESAGEWLHDNYGYLAFRLATPTDTLLGWIHLYTYSEAENGAYLEVLGWAIQPDVSHVPYTSISATPSKDVYCPGDTVVFQAIAFEADQFAWHFWDGTTDSSLTATRVLPDSTVSATFEAGNQNGTVAFTQTLPVSPLVLTAPDITLDCAHPTGTLSATTNVPADICWTIGADTICNAIPLINFPGPIFVTARDQYGCVASEQIDILLDTSPPDVVIEYDEASQLLVAQSFTPGVTFVWSSAAWPGPVSGDSVFIAASGTYTVEAIAPNGCTSTQSITVALTDVQEPQLDAVRLQPNPAHDFLQVEHRPGEAWNYRVFDATGRVSLLSGRAPAGNPALLDLTALPGGPYWLAGYDAGGKRLFFKKFVKL